MRIFDVGSTVLCSQGILAWLLYWYNVRTWSCSYHVFESFVRLDEWSSVPVQAVYILVCDVFCVGIANFQRIRTSMKANLLFVLEVIVHTMCTFD
jgi:hypothetical protein